jgi:outer membrane lipoprotein-sorting protein
MSPLRRAAAIGCIVLGLFAGKPNAFAQASPPAAAAETLQLSQLMAAFSRMPGLEARFVEEKHLSMLARPLSSQGRLYFARPGLLLRRVEQPQKSEVLITPQQLTLKDANGEQRIDLASRPDVRPFVESLTWLLAGDEKALSGVYKVEFVPAAAGAWQLTLSPKAEPLLHVIAYIRVLGQGLAVREIQVREKGGDETVTRIVEANPERKFGAAELASLFGVKPNTSMK